MRVLILGSDTPLGSAVLERAEPQGRHEFVSLTSSACRWKSERQAKRSEEHTSELQSRSEIVCRLLLDTKNTGHFVINTLK